MIMDSLSRSNREIFLHKNRNQSNYDLLRNIFLEMKNVLVAYSGGVDSTVLLKIGTDVLGAHCIGVLGISPSLAAEEKNQALRLAKQIKANVDVITTGEMENPLYIQNDQRRCFYCKQELYTEIWRLAEKRKIHYIVDGTNADDINDYRPGMEAARELQIRSPLLEAELGKDDIRGLARYLKISIWNKPAQPCLASRVMYGQSINPRMLQRIDRAEQFIKSRGYEVVRVRSMGSSASVEVGKNEVTRALQEAETLIIVKRLRHLGFQQVYIDPDGYRQGKLNQRFASD
jgi:uncharacterized protein